MSGWNDYFENSGIQINNWRLVYPIRTSRGLGNPGKVSIREITENDITRYYLKLGNNWETLYTPTQHRTMSLADIETSKAIALSQDILDTTGLVFSDARIITISTFYGKEVGLYKKFSDTAYSANPYVPLEHLRGEAVFFDVAGSTLVDYMYPEMIRHNMEHDPDVSPDNKGRVIFDIFEWNSSGSQDFSMIICDTVFIK